MNEMGRFDYSLKPEAKTIRGKYLGVALLLLAFGAFGCSDSGEKSAGKTEPRPAAPAPVAEKTVAQAPVATPAPEVKKPEARKAPQAEQPVPSLGITPEEFRLRFNKTSELVKSKLRIKKIMIEAGNNQDNFKHFFNENLQLTGQVNKGNGLLAEVNFAGVLNGSLATTVDINVSFGTIITAFSPGLSPDGRDSVLYDLGITNNNVDIYSLDKTVTKNGITYWVKSTRKTGIRFGARSAGGK